MEATAEEMVRLLTRFRSLTSRRRILPTKRWRGLLAHATAHLLLITHGDVHTGRSLQRPLSWPVSHLTVLGPRRYRHYWDRHTVDLRRALAVQTLVRRPSRPPQAAPGHVFAKAGSSTECCRGR